MAVLRSCIHTRLLYLTMPAAVWIGCLLPRQLEAHKVALAVCEEVSVPQFLAGLAPWNLTKGPMSNGSLEPQFISGRRMSAAEYITRKMYLETSPPSSQVLHAALNLGPQCKCESCGSHDPLRMSNPSSQSSRTFDKPETSETNKPWASPTNSPG